MLAIFVFLLFFKLLPGIWLSLLRNSLTLSGHAFKFLRVVVGGVLQVGAVFTLGVIIFYS